MFKMSLKKTSLLISLVLLSPGVFAADVEAEAEENVPADSLPVVQNGAIMSRSSISNQLAPKPKPTLKPTPKPAPKPTPKPKSKLDTELLNSYERSDPPFSGKKRINRMGVLRGVAYQVLGDDKGRFDSSWNCVLGGAGSLGTDEMVFLLPPNVVPMDTGEHNGHIPANKGLKGHVDWYGKKFVNSKPNDKDFWVAHSAKGGSWTPTMTWICSKAVNN